MEHQALAIFVCRHPHHINDVISAAGGMQAIKLAQHLKQRTVAPDRIIHSGAARTCQAASFMGIAVSLYEITPEKNENFHYMTVINNAAKGDPESINENHEKIIKEGGTVRAAIANNFYARRAKDHLEEELTNLGQEMERLGQKCAWIVSHGFFAELAVPISIRGEVPYGIGYCDTIVYQMSRSKDDCEIINAEYLPFDSIKK